MSHRIALVGCGFFARNHAHAWRDLAPRAELVAVCDSDPARAEAFAADFGARAFNDAAAMLDAVRPDAVDIVTTPPSHRALVELAASRAPLVICQKPIADTLADAEAMVAACERAGSRLLIHENFRWQRPMIRARALIDEGRIGTLRHGRIDFRHRWPVYDGQPYLAQQERLAIMDVGVHVLDLVRFFFGEALAITCETQHRNPAVRGEDAFTALTRHANDAVCVTGVSFHSVLKPEPFPETTAILEGDLGTLEVTLGYGLRLHLPDGVTEEDCEPPVPAWGAWPWHAVQDSVRALNAHALDVLDGRAAPQPSGADNVRTLALALAAYDSAESGRRIVL